MRRLTLPSALRHARRQYSQYRPMPKWIKPHEGFDSGIRIYNCAARRSVPLLLPNMHFATWYTCGPTVYDAAHLGHASCYVKLDILQRILRDHFNLNLVTAMNITDVDDKIIRRSQETGQNWRELAKFHEAQFWLDMRRLNVAEPNMKMRVSENIPKIVAFIEDIVAKQLAYAASDNSVYFDVNQFPYSYGKLHSVSLEELSEGVPEHKLSAADFALWKAKKSPDEPSWPSPWGEGRPGWHIECSALASMAFGAKIDFHAGGLDLRFPHHENEEAQSCVYHNTSQWVNYWLHAGQLSVKGDVEKMSKSLKNTISIDDMLSKYTADEFRMACVLSNYRSSMDYGDDVMEMARNTLRRFISFKADCRAYLMGKKRGSNLDANSILSNLHYAKMQVDAAFKDDFDTALSVRVLADLTSGISRCINEDDVVGMSEQKKSSCLDTVAACDNYVQQILRSFGFAFVSSDREQAELSDRHEQEIDLNGLLEDILQSRRIIRDRAVAEKSKDLFQICDELRNCLRQNGIEVKDHSEGSSWSLTRNKKII